MRITLISSDDEVWASGMRSISAMLRAAGHETTMIFASGNEASVNESVIDGISELAGDSEIIGISSMSRGSLRAKVLIKKLRPLGKLIVWGGMHPTLFPEDCSIYPDLICRGEGEGFMLDLAERVATGRGFEDIPNGAYLSNGHIIINDLRPLLFDLDSLPLLDFSFEKEYIVDAAGMVIPNKKMREKGVILFSGSRGCINNCSYCSNSQLKSIYKDENHYIRKMSISRFVEAANEYRRLFPRAMQFYFTDEDFFARSAEEIRELAEIYPEKVGLPFQCMASPHQITEEKVALAAKAGMIQIDVGLESGSERIRRDIFNRYVNDKTQIHAAIAINKHAPGSALYFLILGNPYEKRQDLIDGLHFLEKLPPPFSLRAYNLVFIPGTKLYKRACYERIIEGIDDSAFQLDFLSGYDYRTNDWKEKNIYLNSLMSLMHGKSTQWRIGVIPRKMIHVLSDPRIVKLCDRHPRVGKTICHLSCLRLRLHLDYL